MRFQYVLIGGGLQNGLIALALLHTRPGVRIAVVEREQHLGGNHTWCFHAGDVDAHAMAFLEPLLAYRWASYEVRFPAHHRVLEQPYAGITSEGLDHVVRAALLAAPGCAVFTGHTATEVTAEHARLASGEVLEGDVVVDARGPQAGPLPRQAGYQKFVGAELVLTRPHRLERPIVMDATVPQTDGFRFFYVLPLASDRVLVEDTYFSDTAILDQQALRTAIFAYARAAGLSVASVARYEHGVLPLPWAGEAPVIDQGPLIGGYQGGWFHPVTGYSLPTAVRLAQLIAATPPESLFGEPLRALAAVQRKQLGFCYRLNKMLFRWFPPDQRYHVLERFYRLPEATIRRFYALQLTTGDRARILLGRPPKGMSLTAALAARSS